MSYVYPEGKERQECPSCGVGVGDTTFINGFVGSCPNCQIGKFPHSFLARMISTDDGNHIFTPVKPIYCESCHMPVKEVLVYCQRIEVTQEFINLSEGKYPKNENKPNKKSLG